MFKMLFITNSDKLNNNQKIIASLFILLPVFLITGPFLSDLAVSIIAIYFFFNVKNFKINYRNKYIIIFFIFYFLTLVNSFNFDYYYFSLKSFLFYFRFLLFIIVISSLIHLEEKIIHDFFKICLLAFILILVAGLFQYFYIRFGYFKELALINDYDKFITLKNSTQQRVSGLFGDELIMGSYLMKLFPSFLGSYLIIAKLKKKNYVFLSTLIILNVIGILITADRAPLILFCFTLFLLFIFIKSLRKLFWYNGLIAFFLIIIVLLFDPIVKERTINTTIDNIMGEYSDGKKVIISKAHEGHFNAAKLIFYKYPLLGSGIKGFRNQCQNNLTKDKNIDQDTIACSTHPHNYFLHVLSETGFLGITIYFILILYCIKQLFQFNKNNKNNKINKLNDIRKLFLINFIVILWPLTTSGSFFNNYNTILFSIPIIFYVYLNKLEVNHSFFLK